MASSKYQQAVVVCRCPKCDFAEQFWQANGSEVECTECGRVYDKKGNRVGTAVKH